jgi:hypothetical protein
VCNVRPPQVRSFQPALTLEVQFHFSNRFELVVAVGFACSTADAPFGTGPNMSDSASPTRAEHFFGCTCSLDRLAVSRVANVAAVRADTRFSGSMPAAGIEIAS